MRSTAPAVGSRRGRAAARPSKRFEPQPLERAVGPYELGDELVGGVDQDLRRGVVLGQPPALTQDRDLVPHLDRLVDVVGDEHDRLADLLLEVLELVLQPGAVDRVDRTERLVHQHQRRVGGERPGDAHPLALPARELRRVAVADLGLEG